MADGTDLICIWNSLINSVRIHIAELGSAPKVLSCLLVHIHNLHRLWSASRLCPSAREGVHVSRWERSDLVQKVLSKLKSQKVLE
jgi:hypothetical protein